jgi:small subunit ribosomal protein S6
MFAREYELIWIVKPDVADEDVEAITERTKNVITERNGTILDLDDWGKRKLAYDVQKFSKGHYVRMQFLAQPVDVAELERTLRIDDRILRFLTVKLIERVVQETRAVEFVEEKAKADAAAALAAPSTASSSSMDVDY